MYRIINHGIQPAKAFVQRGPGNGFNTALVGVGYTLENAYQDARDGVSQLVTLDLPETNPWGIDDLEVADEDVDKLIFCFVEIQFNS